MRLPSSIFVSVSLFTAETTAALYLSSTYRSDGDQIWQGLTLLFTLVTSVLVQLTLTFIHRDLSRDRPLVLLLHILQLGPIVRCLEAFCIYGSVGRVEEPYVSITRKRQMPRGGQSEEVERQVGQAEGKLFTHRAAFARTSVIQAFLGSAPQLTLQLYICVLQQGVSIGRGTLMVISLLSIVYGALRCNILAIKIKYDDYEVDVRPAAYLCIFLWRSFEIATRVTVLVLFSSVLQLWILPVVLLNFFLFFLYPWVLFWQSHSPFPENIEKTLTRVGTTIVLCLLTFLYAGINMFCWSAVQLKLNDPDLINKSQNWYRMAVYYMLSRYAETQPKTPNSKLCRCRSTVAREKLPKKAGTEKKPREEPGSEGWPVLFQWTYTLHYYITHQNLPSICDLVYLQCFTLAWGCACTELDPSPTTYTLKALCGVM
ncbi:membrane transport protein XK isoform X2 [Oncorhynchus masou masou]|uniref:membrane transport protein XK isoform X2 n=1 Tax=Oncorhynchus masou masou TaxID=90313 RepID=UPI0031837656